jgi:transcriptional regulator with XRE-family HTH domain
MARTNASKRRASDQATKTGDEVALARTILAFTRDEVAKRARVAWSTVARVENGDPKVALDTLCAVAGAVGLDVVVRCYPSRQPGLRDTGQLDLAELLRKQAHSSWHVTTEVPAGPNGEAIDLGFFDAEEILDTEVERMAGDFQGQYRRNNLKREALAAQHRRPVRLVIAVEDTRRNRAALQPHLPFIRSMLPAGSREILTAIRDGHPLGRDGLLWIRRRQARAAPS